MTPFLCSGYSSTTPDDIEKLENFGERVKTKINELGERAKTDESAKDSLLLLANYLLTNNYLSAEEISTVQNLLRSSQNTD